MSTNELPEGTDWGENTRQAVPGYPDPDDPPARYDQRHSDADEIRRKFGISPYSDNWKAYEHPYPNCLVHTPDGKKWGHPGGTNFLATAGKGAGKSTFALYWSARLMEVNNEAVVWRGVSGRSEWLPFAPWTTLYLPANVEQEARWKPRNMRRPNEGEPATLENIVRDVKYYEDPVDVNDQLKPGTFNVVYPDPSFTGCEEIMLESDYVGKNVEFVPLWDADTGEGTPIDHWWFAYFVSKLEYGPWDWTSVIFDEVQDFAPQDASNTENAQTHAMIESLRKVIDQSRKFWLSVFFFAQGEADLHAKIRRTMQWRVSLPDESGNPTKHDRPPKGFSDIPMEKNMLKGKDAGHNILWTPGNFTRFKSDDIPDPEEYEDRWLKISRPETTTRARSSERKQTRGVPSDD